MATADSPLDEEPSPSAARAHAPPRNEVLLADSIANARVSRALRRIVRTHAALAVGSAFIPVPGADVASSAANVWTMYVRINRAIGLPVGKTVVQSLASGVVTNVASAAAGMLSVGAALKLMPGLGSVGGATIMGATIYAVTVVAGDIYIRILTSILAIKSLESVTDADIQERARTILADKGAIRKLVKQAMREYKTLRNKSRP